MAHRPWYPRFKHLLGKLSDAKLARLAGVTAGAVGGMRRRRGVAAFQTRPRAWEIAARPHLGSLTDAEIGRRVGVTSVSIGRLRSSLGIPAVPTRRTGTRLFKAQARKLRSKLSGADLLVLQGRSLTTPPRSLAQIAADLGLSKQAVAMRERQIAARM